MVLLEHQSGENTEDRAHFDWLIELGEFAEDQARPLLSFRVDVRPDADPEQAFGAVRTPDHRAVYLEYEGAISGGRGQVKRVGCGVCQALRFFKEQGGGRIELRGRFEGGRSVLWVMCEVVGGGDEWRIEGSLADE